MMSEDGRDRDVTAFADQQTAAEGGPRVVQSYEDAAGVARGAESDSDDDGGFDDEAGVDDEDEDEIDLDEEEDDDDLDDDEDDLDDEGDPDALDDEDDLGQIDDDGNPV